MSNENTITKYGPEFQEKLLKALLYDKQWALGMVEILNVKENFDQPQIKLIAEQYLNYYKNYKEFPTTETLMMVVRSKLGENKANDLLKKQVAEFFADFKTAKDYGDLPWIKEETETFCRHQAIRDALDESIQLFKLGNYESILGRMKDAVGKTINQTIGHSYNEDIDARYSLTSRKAVPTNIPELDDKYIMNGGLGNGELGIIVANSGYGKTHILCHMGASAALQGENVFHYSFELKERIVGIRYDSHFIQIPSTECPEHIDEIKEFFDLNKHIGRLQIKEYPPNTATAGIIRSHVDKMIMKGIKPGMLIVDYAQIMKASERQAEKRFEYKAITEELRTLAVELDIPIWTAIQANKEGINSEIIDTGNMSEAYAQSNIADVILGFTRPKELKVAGVGKLHVAKCRAGRDGDTFFCHLDTSRSTLRIISEEEFEKIKDEISSGHSDDSDDDDNRKSTRSRQTVSKHTLNNRDYLKKVR